MCSQDINKSSKVIKNLAKEKFYAMKNKGLIILSKDGINKEDEIRAKLKEFREKGIYEFKSMVSP